MDFTTLCDDTKMDTTCLLYDAEIEGAEHQCEWIKCSTCHNKFYTPEDYGNHACIPCADDDDTKMDTTCLLCDAEIEKMDVNDHEDMRMDVNDHGKQSPKNNQVGRGRRQSLGLTCTYCGVEGYMNDECHCHRYDCNICEPDNFCSCCASMLVYPAI